MSSSTSRRHTDAAGTATTTRYQLTIKAPSSLGFLCNDDNPDGRAGESGQFREDPSRAAVSWGMQRQWRPGGTDHATTQDPQTRTVGKATLTEAIGHGAPVVPPRAVGIGAGGVPRLNLYPSGIGEGSPPGEIQALREQTSTASAPEAGPAGPAAEPSAHANAPGKPAAETAKADSPAAPVAPSSSQGPAGAGQGKPAPPTPPTITHRTVLHAPSGAADTRTSVGVGESIVFDSTATGDWSADLVKSGKSATAHGTRYEWWAPSTAGTAKISFDPGGGAAKIDTTITIIEPSVDYRGATAVPFPGQAPGKAGVAMTTNVFYTPDTVSFAKTMWWEKPGPATGATGYFVGKSLPYHHPTAADLQINTGNTGIIDTAGFWGFTPPYSAGFFEWVIPTHYKVTGDAGRHLITNVHQTCNIDATGTMTVAKGGSTPISRAP